MWTSEQVLGVSGYVQGKNRRILEMPSGADSTKD